MAGDALKPVVDDLVDLVLDVVFSRESEAGWLGKSVLGRVETFGLSPAEGSGPNDLAVWNQGRVLRDWSAAHQRAMKLIDRVSPKKREAMLINRAYLNKTKVTEDPVTGERKEITWTGEKIAHELGISPNAFRKRSSEGYKQIYQILESDSQRRSAA